MTTILNPKYATLAKDVTNTTMIEQDYGDTIKNATMKKTQQLQII
jgi:hypothetical protein